MRMMTWSRIGPFAQRPVGRGNLRPIFLLLALVCASGACCAQTTVLWSEGFEDDSYFESWHMEGSVWAVGVPTSGPGKAFAGIRCGATVLDGNYPPGADARFV